MKYLNSFLDCNCIITKNNFITPYFFMSIDYAELKKIKLKNKYRLLTENIEFFEEKTCQFIQKHAKIDPKKLIRINFSIKECIISCSKKYYKIFDFYSKKEIKGIYLPVLYTNFILSRIGDLNDIHLYEKDFLVYNNCKLIGGIKAAIAS